MNVQALVEKSKKFMWSYPSNEGTSHDSSAFSSSRLDDLLKEIARQLHDLGLFLVGDSAYNLTSYLLTPYDTQELKTDTDHSKDAFNYHLSCCRIFVECAFGELIMRWGIF